MKRIPTMLVAVLLFMLSVVAWTGLTRAHSFRTGANVTSSQAEKIDHTLFAAGNNIDINSEVSGDVICAGQTVNISGTVHGDVICAGQTVRVTGTVDGDVRLAGQTVALGADVKGNATIGAQTFNLESSAKVAGDVTAGSTSSTFNGTVGRDVAVGGDVATFSSVVGRDIKAGVNHLNLTSQARVAGIIDLTSENDINQSADATVGGKVSRHAPAKNPAASKNWAIFGFSVGWFVYWFLAMLLTALALALLFPRVLHSTSEAVIDKPWKALLTGLVSGLVVPVVLVVLAITLIGIPLAIILGLMWLVVVLLSGPFFAYYLGRLILSESSRPLAIMAVGASVLSMLYFIPILGFIAFLAALWTGSGMIVNELMKRTPRPVYDLGKTVSQPKPTKKANS